MANTRIPLPMEEIEAFCRKWKVKEFSLFGSVLTDAFQADRDVGVLVVFEEDSGWDLWDHMHAEEELGALPSRDVDLVEKRAVKNPFRRYHILEHLVRRTRQRGGRAVPFHDEVMT